MKRLLAAHLLLLSAGAFAVTPGEIMSEFAEAPGKSGGIYYAYPHNDAPAIRFPAGYTPLYVSHYGRHGSRWAIREQDYPFLTKVLEKELESGNLTDKGVEVLEKIRRIEENARGHAGELSPKGQRQHKGIAARMAARTPGLFSGTGRVSALSSVEPRCIVSMAAFTEALKEGNPALQIERSASPGDMAFISHSTPEAKAFTRDDAPWRVRLDDFGDSVADPSRLKALIFKRPGEARLPRKFWRTLHDVAVTTQNIDFDNPAVVDLLSMYTPAELFGYWQFLNYKMYVGNANAPFGDAIGMKCARPLLDDIIARADSTLSNPADSPQVQLRFGHDTALIRLLALMGLEGCDAREGAETRYCEAWQDYRVSPMGANLQLVFMRPDDEPAGEPLVLILHNERPAHVRAEAVQPDCYRWSDLKRLWGDR